MNKKTIFGALAIFIVIASIAGVSAFQGKFPGMDQQGRANMVNSIKANDFNTWKEMMSARLTQENFNNLVERQTTMSQRYGNMSGMRRGLSYETCNEEMRQAIENSDYEAWKVAAVNSPMMSKILNEDDFKILVQLHETKQDGNFTQVKELSEQLGLPGGYGKHRMPGNFGRGRMN